VAFGTLGRRKPGNKKLRKLRHRKPERRRSTGRAEKLFRPAEASSGESSNGFERGETGGKGDMRATSREHKSRFAGKRKEEIEECHNYSLHSRV